MSKNTARKAAAKVTRPKARNDAPRLISFLAGEKPKPSRTARGLYEQAVRARLGMQPNESNIDDRWYAMSPGEMLLWALGGCVMTDDLFGALLNVRDDLRMLNASDLGREALGERLEGLATRLDVIATIHHGALEKMAAIPLEGTA